MPCGLTNPTTLMILMNTLFHNYLDKFVLVFMNYKLILSKKIRNTKSSLDKCLIF